MYNLTDEQFDALITRAMDVLTKNILRVWITLQSAAADRQPKNKVKMKLRENTVPTRSLQGYTSHAAGHYRCHLCYQDKITLFKHSILRVVRNDDELLEKLSGRYGTKSLIIMV